MLKIYLRSATFGSKDIVIRKSEFAARTQFLLFSLTLRRFIVTGNDIFPSKMCMGHKCLELCNIDEVTRSFNDLLDVLFQYTTEVRIVEPPPRCKRIAGHPDCTFWEDIVHEDRFRVLISRIKTIRSRNEEILGVVSNKYLMRAINGHTIWSLTGSDLTHFSKPALIQLSKLIG